MYDGQNYEATDFLPTGNGEAKKYIEADKEERVKFEQDSMAIETEEIRDEFNKRFSEIYGLKPIDENGNTEGQSTNGTDTFELDYTSRDYKLSENEGDSRKISTLVTRNEEGYVIDHYKMMATTGAAGLIYPFEDEISIDNADDVEEISLKDEDGRKTIIYRTIYNYNKN